MSYPHILREVSCIIAVKNSDSGKLGRYLEEGRSSGRFEKKSIKATRLPAGRHNPEGTRRILRTLESRGVEETDTSKYIGLELRCSERNKIHLEEEIQRITSLFKEAKEPAVAVGE